MMAVTVQVWQSQRDMKAQRIHVAIIVAATSDLNTRDAVKIRADHQSGAAFRQVHHIHERVEAFNGYWTLKSTVGNKWVWVSMPHGKVKIPTSHLARISTHSSVVPF
jgi:hypothetical protein